VCANESPELAAQRAAARAWLEQHAAVAPSSAEEAEGADSVTRRRAWQGRLADAGLIGVTWPVAHGGRGLSAAHARVVEQELEAAGVPGAFDVVGVGMVGPTIIAHGRPEQQERFLRPLLRAEEVWCQLFSEPAAGSDLAAVRTAARRERDGTWLVSGQKVWTSHAQHAAFALMLARTDVDVPKHQGLTMFVVPMTAAGITVRPLRQISGADRFSEVFLDEVRLEPDAVLGEIGEGWRVAMDMLAGERVALSRSAESLAWRVEDFAAALASAGDPGDAAVHRRLGEIACDMLAVRWSPPRADEADGAGAAAPLAKITAVDAATRAGDLLCDVLGPAALIDPRWGRMVSELPGLRSAGGPSEIVRTLVGERALGLPPEPRVDKGIAFSDLPIGVSETR
jgi:alkylation response protein AidB-like acyl-CoA dehydrogenase